MEPNPAYLLLGVFAFLWGLVVVSVVRAIRRHRRMRRHGKYIDLTVVSATVGNRGLRNTVWMETVLSAALPNGQSRRAMASIRVHLDRVEEIQPGFVVRGRVDPRDYTDIRLDADHLAERPQS